MVNIITYNNVLLYLIYILEIEEVNKIFRIKYFWYVRCIKILCLFKKRVYASIMLNQPSIYLSFYNFTNYIDRRIMEEKDTKVLIRTAEAFIIFN